MLQEMKPNMFDLRFAFQGDVRKQQSKILWKFAKSLQRESDSEDVNKAARSIDRIFKVLDQIGEISIDRGFVAGSVGKGTSLPGSDYDLVIFLNKEEPPFDKIIEKIKSVLIEMTKFNYIRSTSYSLTFSLDGRNFDILPAVNLTSGKTEKTQKLRAQLNQTLKKFEEGNGKFSNSSLAEFAVAFVIKQPNIIRNVIRLAKFWTQMIDIKLDVPGLSMILEMVVIGCNRQRKKKCFLTCFERFLIGMANFQSLKITYFVYYQRSRVPAYIMDQAPLILDPANPMNNLGQGVSEEVINIFQTAARQTLQKIANLNGTAPNERDIPDIIDPWL